jgi:small subunit ribosomal protein S18
MSMSPQSAGGGQQRRREGGSGEGRSGAGGPGGGGGGFFRRRKSCPFSGSGAPKIDYKNVRMLSRFVSERGKIVPSRISAVSAPKQRELANAIKRARFLALLPYCDTRAGDR